MASFLACYYLNILKDSLLLHFTVSDGGEHEKPSKKDLLGRRKEKKEKKDRGYAALEGESSPEEDTDTK